MERLVVVRRQHAVAPHADEHPAQAGVQQELGRFFRAGDVGDGRAA